MKASKEERRWLNRLRAKVGKPNGVVPGALLDSPVMERKRAASKAARSLALARLAELDADLI